MPTRRFKYNYSDIMKELDEEIDEAIEALEKNYQRRISIKKKKISRDIQNMIDSEINDVTKGDSK